MGPARGPRAWPAAQAAPQQPQPNTQPAPCTRVPPGLTQPAGGPHPLRGAEALEAVHPVHAGAARRARVRGALVDVCGRGTGGGERRAGRLGPGGRRGLEPGASCHGSPGPAPERPSAPPAPSSPRGHSLTQRAGGSAPAGRAVALEARGHLVAGAPVGAGVRGAGVLGCVGAEAAVGGGVTAGPPRPTPRQSAPLTPRPQAGAGVPRAGDAGGALGHLPRSQFLPA